MSEVALSIGGKIYRVACAPGEESHVSELGSAINEKLTAMGNLSGHEPQNLLFAALVLADEVHEARNTAGRADSEIAGAPAAADSVTGEIEELKAALANRDVEFQRIQSDHADAAREAEAARQRLADLSERLAEHQANEAALHDQIDALTRERDELAWRPEPGPAPSHAPEQDLAPALERLAEMLEQTADKLEGAPKAP